MDRMRAVVLLGLFENAILDDERASSTVTTMVYRKVVERLLAEIYGQPAERVEIGFVTTTPMVREDFYKFRDAFISGASDVELEEIIASFTRSLVDC